MRRVRYALAVALTAGALLIPAGTVLAGEDLPVAACNPGTENAHERIPLGRPSHERVPDNEEGTSCEHQIGYLTE